MKLTFLGTRGYIEAKTARHRRHTALLVAYRGKAVMIDCGEDWLGSLDGISAQALVLTHAHPDHAGGLREGVPWPLYATDDAWEDIKQYPIETRRKVTARKPFTVAGMTFEAFTVEHSINCPAVGYRITAGRVTVFYVPDVVYIHEREQALKDVRLYIGDGATMHTSFVRKQGDWLMGHTPVQTQLTWCQKEGVEEAIVTHCGSEIVEGDERRLAAALREMARERDVRASFAFDGMERTLR